MSFNEFISAVSLQQSLLTGQRIVDNFVKTLFLVSTVIYRSFTDEFFKLIHFNDLRSLNFIFYLGFRLVNKSQV